MANDLRAVIDTGVIISAVILPQSGPRQVFDYVIDQGTLLASTSVIEELDSVLRRPDFDRYVSKPLRLEFLAGLVRIVKLVQVTDSVSECRDPDDNRVLELALSGFATRITTGDNDLLVLNPFRGIPIVTPRDFLSEINDGTKTN